MIRKQLKPNVMKHLFIVLLLIVSNCILAQNKKDTPGKQIKLTGWLSNDILKEIEKLSGTAPHLIVSEDYNEYIPANQKTIPIQIINNKFSTAINFNAELGYIRFFIPGMRINSTSHDMFLFMTGDSVNIQIKNEHEIEFSGKGADRLNYQHWASMLKTPYMPFVEGPGFSKVERISYEKSYISKNIKLAIDSLNKISSKWIPEVKDIIKLNTIATFNYRYITGITNLTVEYSAPYLASLKNELNYVLSQQSAFLEKDSCVINTSFQFIDYLYLLNGINEQVMLNRKNIPFEVLFNKFKNEYDGQLRGKLLVKHFLKQKSLVNLTDYLKDAIKIVHDKTSSKILNNLLNMKVKGADAFNFQFVDMDGKLVTLKDNKDKIIIIDAYYLGCTACAVLTKKMMPVMEHFSKRKDVVFISLNALDKDLARVENGVNSGRYGDKGTVYVHTNGIGDRHPYILFYNILSYPDQIVIDKKGEILDINPVKGFNDTEAFQEYMITTIERNL